MPLPVSSCVLQGHVTSSHQGFWLWMRSHTDWHAPLLQAWAAGPPRGQEVGMLQQVPVALGAHWASAATIRLHFIVPGQGMLVLQAMLPAAAHAPWAATEMPWKAACSAFQ
jgi:hypothetical protein